MYLRIVMRERWICSAICSLVKKPFRLFCRYSRIMARVVSFNPFASDGFASALWSFTEKRRSISCWPSPPWLCSRYFFVSVKRSRAVLKRVYSKGFTR